MSRAPARPEGLRMQFPDGSQRTPDAVLYAGRTPWRPWKPRLDRWEVYVYGPTEPIGFSADLMPGRCALVFHVRLFDPNV